MSKQMHNAASALWWAGHFSMLAAKLRKPHLNLLARRFQAEFQRERVRDKVARLREETTVIQPAE